MTCKCVEATHNIPSFKIIHTFAERIGEGRRRRKRMEEFSLTVFHTQRVNNLK
jgi:hypothetical protein